jgi:hypothetical protein
MCQRTVSTALLTPPTSHPNLTAAVCPCDPDYAGYRSGFPFASWLHHRPIRQLAQRDPGIHCSSVAWIRSAEAPTQPLAVVLLAMAEATDDKAERSTEQLTIVSAPTTASTISIIDDTDRSPRQSVRQRREPDVTHSGHDIRCSRASYTCPDRGRRRAAGAEAPAAVCYPSGAFGPGSTGAPTGRVSLPPTTRQTSIGCW